MSTRSLINVGCLDSKVRSIYVHHDGMDHLKTLQENYNSQEKAESLITLGDLSKLGVSLKDCVAYGRDRNESDCEAEVYESFEEAVRRNADQEYIYEWVNARWVQFKVTYQEDGMLLVSDEGKQIFVSYKK